MLMRKIRIAMLSVVATVVLLAWAVPALAAHTRAAGTTVTVTAGKPSELAFALSTKTVPHGTVTFKVKNAGALSHDFSIGGKTTPLLKTGASATLTVTFAKAGSYPYECTVPGHAAGGMKGTLKVT
jgi:uncharacterized cupredoxin-like copper-binding protein